jgi:hypothetical protein
MRRWVWALFLLLLGGLAVCLAGCSSTSPAERDSWRVLCLSPTKRPDLVNAAITLRLATPASTSDRLRVGGLEMTADQWQRSHRDDFDKACTALVDSPSPAAGGGDSALVSGITSILSVVAGGVLTLAGGMVQAKFTDSRRRAENLRSAGHGYARTSRAYLDAWVQAAGRGRPDGRQVTERFEDLDAELRGCRSARTGGVPVRALRDELRAITDDLIEGPGEPRNPWAIEVRQRVSDLESQTERMADALEHPLRPRGRRESGGTA